VRPLVEGAPLAGYEALAAHAELELELAGRGELSEMAGLESRWEELVAALPEQAPREARPLLARAQLIHERTRVELLRLREALLRDVAQATRAKRTADGYVGAGGRPGVRALDRSA